MTVTLVAYFIIGLIAARMVRLRVGLIGGVWIRHSSCKVSDPRVSDCYNRVNGYGILCPNRAGVKSGFAIFTLFGAVFLWPLYILGAFVLVEKLPKPYKTKTDREAAKAREWDKMLSEDPVLKSTYDEISEKYKVATHG